MLWAYLRVPSWEGTQTSHRIITGTLKSQVWNRPLGQCMSLVQCQGLLRLPGMGEGARVECWPRRHPDYGEAPRKIAREKTEKQTLRVEGPKEITPGDLSVPGALPQHLV